MSRKRNVKACSKDSPVFTDLKLEKNVPWNPWPCLNSLRFLPFPGWRAMVSASPSTHPPLFPILHSHQWVLCRRPGFGLRWQFLISRKSWASYFFTVILWTGYQFALLVDNDSHNGCDCLRKQIKDHAVNPLQLWYWHRCFSNITGSGTREGSALQRLLCAA